MLRKTPLTALLTTLLLACAQAALACPFCVSEMQTLSEEIASADAVIIGRLAKPVAAEDSTDGPAAEDPADGTTGPPTVDPETGQAVFTVESALKGGDQITGIEQVEAIYFGRVDYEKAFLLRGIGTPLEWGIPIELSPLAVDYVKQLPTLPKSGPDRLAFFQPYLEHDDRQLAQDAYDEFARAPMDDLNGLANRMDRERVIELIQRPHISASRRRLFFMMLGVCGTAEDAALLEEMIKPDTAVLIPAAEAMAQVGVVAGGPLSSVMLPEVALAQDRRRKAGLDAMVACYVALRGEGALDLIDRRFLANPDANQTHIYSTLMSLRYLSDSEPGVSRDRLLQSARLLLDNRLFADQVVTDLARWEDWEVMPRLAEMFRVADDPESGVSKYVRDPIVTYMDIAAEQPGEVGEQAVELLAELEPLAPETFRMMRSMQAFGALTGALRPDPTEPESPEAETPGAETDAADDMPPNPADFAGASDEPPAAQEAEAGSVADDQSGSPADPAPAATAARRAPIPAGAEPLAPPSRVTLLLAPLLGAAGCFAVFWVILRGGG